MGLHYKWHINPPLFMQCVVNPMQVYNSPLGKIHLFGEFAKGTLERPWKEERPFENFLGKMGTETKKEEKKRLKAGKGKAKK
eukprot:NODE_5013_length_412_cov_531.005510_g4005_i0.p2 GENE.NODE_5013_length_412_cov_531.005510_g4005_i0~~NODE_5013_length_412_cov_531.005510_g4005_i0.p2  ORF type:complete len:92 (-),score=41.42 NODE_5013_length_412_cov_531.005510_g4005_i0:137-382(-)